VGGRRKLVDNKKVFREKGLGKKEEKGSERSSSDVLTLAAEGEIKGEGDVDDTCGSERNGDQKQNLGRGEAGRESQSMRRGNTMP